MGEMMFETAFTSFSVDNLEQAKEFYMDKVMLKPRFLRPKRKH